MVDLHHHLLWGLDDGSKNVEMSLAMAGMAASDGITHVVCTPHASGKYQFDPEENAARASELQSRLDAESVALKLGLGCDFHLSYDNIQDARESPARFSINGLAYLLVELPDYGVPAQIGETFYELQLAGLTPILTHPERNPTLQADRSKLIDWLRGGVLIQVTGDSVTGKMGKPAERMAHYLLENRWVHFLATDAHNVTSRPPRLSEARDLVAKRYGALYADSLCTSNPMCVFEGKPFEPAEEPRDLFTDPGSTSWFGRMMQRFRSS